MPRNYISIDTGITTARRAQELKTFSQRLREAYELAVRISNVMDQMNDGTNFSDIEAHFGLPAGTGQTVYNMVRNTADSLEGDLQSNDGKQFTQRVG